MDFAYDFDLLNESGGIRLMNPYEVGRPEPTDAELSENEHESEQPYEPRLLRLFLASAARITVYGIMALLMLALLVYWLR